MSLRFKLLFPLALAGLLAAAYVYLSWPPSMGGGPALVFVLFGLLAALLLAAINTELFVQRPLARLTRIARDLPSTLPAETKCEGGDDELAVLASTLTRMRERMQESKLKLEQEADRRCKLEQSLRDVEERYQLAVERANDGVWEWDTATREAKFSPRWKGMLGYLDNDIKHVDQWKELLYPDDREAVLMRLHNHLEALTPNFEAEYRLRHQDGHYRWVNSRGMAIRHAGGRPYRMVMMDKDIDDRRRLEETLIQAAEGLSSVSGEEFFRALMLSLSGILGTRDNLVCQCVGDPPARARTLAYYAKGVLWDNFEYELEGTSCGAVIARREIVYCPTGVCDVWPVEKEYDRDSYIGVPMFDSAGKIIGHFACMDGKPMRQDLPHLAIFKIFSVRAAAELERTLLRRKLESSEMRAA